MRTLARLLDSAVGVPGTGVRFGLDPVLGLIPGAGDVAGAALSGYMVLVARELGASKAVILRMLANVAVDTAVGTIPVLGDLFDVAWKSNTRNLALLEGVVDAPASTKRASIFVIAGALVVLIALALAGVAIAFFVIKQVVELLGY